MTPRFNPLTGYVLFFSMLLVSVGYVFDAAKSSSDVQIIEYVRANNGDDNSDIADYFHLPVFVVDEKMRRLRKRGLVP